NMNVSPAWRKRSRTMPDWRAILLLLLAVPAVAHAQAGGASPFDTGFSAMQNLFTGTVAKVASLIAIVVGGYQFAHGEPGAKKTLHKPLTYLGVERTLFFFVCVAAVGAFNLFNSLVAGLLLFAGGFAFGCWVTGSDPALLRILAKSERFNTRYDAAKQSAPRVE